VPWPASNNACDSSVGNTRWGMRLSAAIYSGSPAVAERSPKVYNGS
jgi:hypothetical protein